MTTGKRHATNLRFGSGRAFLADTAPFERYQDPRTWCGISILTAAPDAILDSNTVAPIAVRFADEDKLPDALMKVRREDVTCDVCALVLLSEPEHGKQ